MRNRIIPYDPDGIHPDDEISAAGAYAIVVANAKLYNRRIALTRFSDGSYNVDIRRLEGQQIVELRFNLTEEAMNALMECRADIATRMSEDRSAITPTITSVIFRISQCFDGYQLNHPTDYAGNCGRIVLYDTGAVEMARSTLAARMLLDDEQVCEINRIRGLMGIARCNGELGYKEVISGDREILSLLGSSSAQFDAIHLYTDGSIEIAGGRNRTVILTQGEFDAMMLRRSKWLAGEALSRYCGQKHGAIAASSAQLGEANFVRVRIAVGIDPNGIWCASGWNQSEIDGSTPEEEDILDTLACVVDDYTKYYWVEVDLPIPTMPDIETVAGTATEAISRERP